jgi:hypothetical protein
MESWAVDLKDVGAIYPFQGSETILVILLVIFWIGWHIWQIRHESATLESERRRAAEDKERKSIDRY